MACNKCTKANRVAEVFLNFRPSVPAAFSIARHTRPAQVVDRHVYDLLARRCFRVVTPEDCVRQNKSSKIGRNVHSDVNIERNTKI